MSSFALLYCVDHLGFACLQHCLLERHFVMTLLLENLAWRHALPQFLQACLLTPEYVVKACLLMYTLIC